MTAKYNDIESISRLATVYAIFLRRQDRRVRHKGGNSALGGQHVFTLY